jgi:hypothetical protein
MKLKLSKAQFKALYSLFQHIVLHVEVKTLEARLLRALLFSIYQKLYKRAIDEKSKYSITLSEEQALAFWVFFNKYNYLPEEMMYEANLVSTISNNIHQKFS